MKRRMAILLNRGRERRAAPFDSAALSQHYLCGAPPAPETFISGSIWHFSRFVVVTLRVMNLRRPAQVSHSHNDKLYGPPLFDQARRRAAPREQCQPLAGG